MSNVFMEETVYFLTELHWELAKEMITEWHYSHEITEMPNWGLVKLLRQPARKQTMKKENDGS